jgi:Fe-S-cluster containining protein
MNIREFSLNLQKLFEDMSSEFSQFQKKAGLLCPEGCGRCCVNPEIEASPLEFIPWALHIYDQGQLEEWLDKLENNQQEICLLYLSGSSEGKGSCSFYPWRPSVCRMFGVAGTLNKRREINLSICRYLKLEHPDWEKTPTEGAPLMADHSLALSSLDPQLMTKKVPLNEAMKIALHKIALYAQLQEI